jgi:hypothetical protein
VIGVAILFGLWIDVLARRMFATIPRLGKVVYAGFVITTLAASIHHNRVAERTSWIAEAAAIAEVSLSDAKAYYPRLSPGAEVVIINNTKLDLNWFYDYGSLFRLFYYDESLRVRIMGPGDALGEFPAASPPIVLTFDGEHLRPPSS